MNFRFFDEYAKEGLTFWGITPQNEPSDGYTTDFSFNCMGWTAEGERDWVTSYLGPTIQKSDHDVKLMILDDQRPFLSTWSDTVSIFQLYIFKKWLQKNTSQFLEHIVVYLSI